MMWAIQKTIRYAIQIIGLKRVRGLTCTSIYLRAKGAERRSGRKPGVRVLIPPAIYIRGNESIGEV
jgi:hypothetical protein